MMVYTAQKQQGFTLIELVIVLVIVGILSAIAIPKYVDLQSKALAATKSEAANAVKSGFAIYIAERKVEPTVMQLAGALLDPSVTAIATGLQVDIDGTNYTVPTYIDTACAIATTAVGDTVLCVGSIS
jgi:MSHA pilin protein MshA